MNDSNYDIYLELCDEINTLVTEALDELEPEEAEQVLQVLEALQESFRFRYVSE